ncbi:DUF3679 domain-containing protein [Aneurinibacillus aneurinilyticus]|uniref:Uncharacterized protein n=1 Tax=Aneurinibacillus aneurinilyticus ATCC 12856 TaxID=649747 RepID=U1Y728_ANEAE|nr:DUF3679 domain-containing protein [Aneurinibacillus aneurinilyticus]ERI07977.1 hypothetical protein HMPREF0083_03985 [Aneurinibacillus aneurinilyticus ATCC 12856]MED0705388.1 DUF3679 domain-containing protein [Aneurinibacillus aneurinilyticus]MED0724993.1 DUF3679 domain-containing protein [Aneurinibacillus aneurinilyticus]MED0730985.1 DUF3679 domain-containing protein [Aneurinibacillus aneurinilyticus]MED0742672.1 DUF3679 domain-containing protein [Aneurinibacillus aneurinilyticus]
MKLTAKFFLLVGVLFAGILCGINLAEKGIQRIEGASDQPVKGFYIKKVENGRFEVEVLGKQVVTEDTLSSARMSSENWISHTGNSVRNWVVTATRNMMKWIMDKL